jgi:hypothetical protein
MSDEYDWTDDTAIVFLQSEGLSYGRDWMWRSPDGRKWCDLTAKQRDAIWYLVMEWDWGGYLDEMG